MKDFHNLKVWERAHQLTLMIYKHTTEFPQSETYGLANQMRRSASSIPTNIAEGCGRESQVELAHFFQISMGSSSELDYQLILAHDLNYLNEKTFQELFFVLNEVRRMLNALINKIKHDNESQKANG